MQIEFFKHDHSIYRLPAISPTSGIMFSLREFFTHLRIDNESNDMDSLFTIAQTPDEISIVSRTSDTAQIVEAARLCSVEASEVKIEPAFCCFRVADKLAFDAIGIIAAISKVFADQEIPILSISTFDTDYFLTASSNIEIAKKSLVLAGYKVQ